MELFLDKASSNFIVDKNTRTAIDTLRMGENVVEPLKLWLLDPPAAAGQPLPPVALDAGFTNLVFSGRPTANLEGADVLFSCVDFTPVGADATLHYEGLLTLNVAAINAALAGLKTLPVLMDVDAVNADSTRKSRLVMQASGIIYRDIYRGTEGVPIGGDPAYPLPQNLLTTATDGAKSKRGTTAVGNGVESQAVAFATAFAAAPSTVLAWLMVPAAGALIQCAVDYSTITTAGFTMLLGAATPNGNYKLGWLAIL